MNLRALNASATTDKVDHGTGTSMDNLEPFNSIALIRVRSIATEGKIYQKGVGANAQIFRVGDTVSPTISFFTARATTNATVIANFSDLSHWKLNRYIWVAGSVNVTTATDSHLYCGDIHGDLAEATVYSAQSIGSGAIGNNNGAAATVLNRAAGSNTLLGDIAFLAIIGGKTLAIDDFALIQERILRGNFQPCFNAALWCFYGINSLNRQFDFSGNANHGTVTGCRQNTGSVLYPSWRFQERSHLVTAAGWGPLLSGRRNYIIGGTVAS